MPVQCSRCGAILADGIRVCSYCGAPIIQGPNMGIPQGNIPVQNQPVVNPYQYGAPGYPIYQPVPKKQSGFGIAGFVMSFFYFLSPLAFVFSLVGIIHNHKVRKHGLAIAGVVLSILGMIFWALILYGRSLSTPSNNTTSSRTESSTSSPLVAELQDDKTNMSIGDISEEGDFLIGLAFVKTKGKLETTLGNEDIPTGYEAVYAIFEVYNNSNEIRYFDESHISASTNSIAVYPSETYFLLACDGMEAKNSYRLDPGTRAFVVTEFETPKGWDTVSFYYGKSTWNVSNDETTNMIWDPLHQTIYNIEPSSKSSRTNITIYDEDYDIQYDGFTVYRGNYSSKTYGVFMFTVTNTSTEDLDYSFVGYRMRGYQNGVLVDDGGSYIINDHINGYTNIYDVDTIKAGLSSQLYVAFEIYDESSELSMAYDTGYMVNDYKYFLYAVYSK